VPVEPPEELVELVVVVVDVPPLEEAGLVGAPGVVVGGGTIRWLSGPPVTVVDWAVGVVVDVPVEEPAEPDPELEPPPPVLGGAVVTGIRGALVGVVVVVVGVVEAGGVEPWLDEPPPDDCTGLFVVVCSGDGAWLSGDETVVVVCCGLCSCVVSTCFFVVVPVESPEVDGALCGALCVGADAGADGCCAVCWSAGAVTGAWTSVAVVPPSATAGEPDGANGRTAESGGTRWPARRPAGPVAGAAPCCPVTGDSAGPPAPAPTEAGAGDGVFGGA